MLDDDLPVPLPQSPECAAALAAMGRPVRRMTWTRDGAVSLCWQVQARRFGMLGRVDLISRGPVAREARDGLDWLGRFGRWQDGRPLVLNADGLPPQALRDAGFWPLVTPGTLALLPLGPTEDMRGALHQKWRNRLNRAEASGLRVTCKPLDPRHWALAEEAAQARAKGYRGLPPAFSAAFGAANPGKALVWEARHEGLPVAAAVVLCHGAMATWQIGVSRGQGRALNAMNLLLWRVMMGLAERGHLCLDLGMLNTQDAAGMTRFKLGTGARLHRLGGSWLHLGALAPIARRLPLGLAA